MLYQYLSCEFQRYEYFLASWAFMETFILAGHRAGWGSLVYVLKQDGIYKDRCENSSNFQEMTFNESNSSSFTIKRVTSMANILFNESSSMGYLSVNDSATDRNKIDSCPEQDAIFELVITISSVLSAPFNLLVGQASFRYGIRTARMISIGMMCIGILSFINVSQDMPWLVFLGYIGIANGGLWILQTNMQISYLFKRCASTVAGFMAGAFDASGAVLLGVKLAYEHGIPLSVSFTIILCSVSLLCISTCFLLPRDVIVPKETKLNRELPISLQDPDEPKSLSEKSRLIASNDRSLKSRFSIFTKISNAEPEQEVTIEKGHDGEASILEDDVAEEQYNKDAKPEENKSRESMLMTYILSARYIMYVFWGTVNQLVFVLFLGSVNAWFGHITRQDQEQVSRNTNFFYSVMLSAPVFSVLAGSSVDFFYSLQSDSRNEESRSLYALTFPSALTSLIGMLLCVCIVFERPEVTYAVAVLSIVYRSFLFSIYGSYLRFLYPAEYFSALMGMMLLISGCFMFLQMPLFLWCQRSESGYKQVYGTLGLCTVLTFLQPVFLLYSGWKKDSKAVQ